jgi:tRNA(Ile)-lysidine synthase
VGDLVQTSLSAFDSQVAGTIERYRLLEPESRVLAAFSGGPDSTALVLVLTRLGYEIVAGHVDHGIRPGSGREAEHCAEVATRLGIPFASKLVMVDPPTPAEARRVRYQALEEMADRFGSDRIATGHTLDDQAETVVMRLLRGGFGMGIPPRRGRVVRPLLEVRRHQTERVCHEAGVPFISDPSNLDERFTRNLIRNRVMPHLSQRAVRRLAGMAERNRRRADALEEKVLKARETGALWQTDGEAMIERQWLAAAPPPLRRAALRRVFEELGLEPSSKAISQVEKYVLPTTGAQLDLAQGWAVWSEPERLVLGHRRPQVVLPEVQIAVPGVTRAQEWGLEIVTQEIEPPEGGPYPSDGAVLDADSVDGLLTLRQRRPGDRFRPLGMPASRKLQDFLVDLKIPRRERDRIPIFTSGDRIAWVGGLRIDDRFKLSETSRRALRIRIFPVLRGG